MELRIQKFDGRLDVLDRLITNKGTAFDRIDKSYIGDLFIEIAAPLTFSIRVRKGTRLNQMRLHRERGTAGGVLTKVATENYYSSGQLIRSPDNERLELREGALVPLTIDLKGMGKGEIVGYRAKSTVSVIDVGLTNYYDPREYWDQIESADANGSLRKARFIFGYAGRRWGPLRAQLQTWFPTILDLGSFVSITRGSLTQASGGKTAGR